VWIIALLDYICPDIPTVDHGSKKRGHSRRLLGERTPACMISIDQTLKGTTTHTTSSPHCHPWPITPEYPDFWKYAHTSRKEGGAHSSRLVTVTGRRAHGQQHPYDVVSIDQTLQGTMTPHHIFTPHLDSPQNGSNWNTLGRRGPDFSIVEQ
jgi:hypothetical protein